MVDAEHGEVAQIETNKDRRLKLQQKPEEASRFFSRVEHRAREECWNYKYSGNEVSVSSSEPSLIWAGSWQQQKKQHETMC